MTTDGGFIRVPTTAADLLPPKPSDLITEASNFIRVHWDDLRDLYLAISGEGPSPHDSVRLDEAALAFRVKEIAQRDGFAFLGDVPTEKLRRALRRGYKRNTGVTVACLEKQNRRLRLEHRQAVAA